MWGCPWSAGKPSERMLDAVDIVRVADSQHIPPISEKASSDILSESDARVAFDRDVVVVPNPAEIVESQMGGERVPLPSRRPPSCSRRHTTV